MVVAQGGRYQEALLWNPGFALNFSADVPLEGSQLGSRLAATGSFLFLFP